ncbi:MAG: DUF4922 domain-containing protein [Deltaproteobacteria bacterium]|nr:DUF4922 domain-containing protein [Deltaproteobacteria bacterium]
MSAWERVLIDAAPPGGGAGFLDWQAARWPRLEAARTQLDAVQTRTLPLRDRPVQLQWNPGRRVNTTAKVDASAIRARPCFLCPANLPAEERGVAVSPELVLLANPFPIGPGHLVFAHREHRPQALLPALDQAVALAAAGELGALFYNGPTCGASAPDHLHLQALAPEVLPDVGYFSDLFDRSALPGETLLDRPDLGVFLDPRLRTTLVLRGEPAATGRALSALLSGLALSGAEPPHNAVLARHGDRLLALLYLRDAHRPACYYAAGPSQRLVSPGAVDMAGMIVTVREEDYLALDQAEVERIFTEVSLPITPELRETLQRSLAHV